MGFIKGRRTSMKQDAMMLLGVILVLCFILGLFVFLLSMYLSVVGDEFEEFFR
jgi:magnesium-transporting ATPase (P-type)